MASNGHAKPVHMDSEHEPLTPDIYEPIAPFEQGYQREFGVYQREFKPRKSTEKPVTIWDAIIVVVLLIIVYAFVIGLWVLMYLWASTDLHSYVWVFVGIFIAILTMFMITTCISQMYVSTRTRRYIEAKAKENQIYQEAQRKAEEEFNEIVRSEIEKKRNTMEQG